MTKRGLHIGLFVFLVLLLNGIIFFWGRVKLIQKQKVVYSEYVEDFSAVDIDGKMVDVNKKSGEWKLIYLSPNMKPDEQRNARFLGMLFEKTVKDNLLIMGVFNVDEKSLIDYKNKLSLPFHIVCYDANKIIKKVLSVNEESSTLLLLDPGNKIIFLSSFFKQSDIKQLVDKYVRGDTGDSPPETGNYLKEGQIFAEISVKNLRSGKFETFPGLDERSLAVIFTGRCPDCLISKFKGTASSFRGVPGLTEGKISFIFSPGFLEDDILINFSDFNADLLLAIDDIPQVENYYDSEYLINEHVLAVEIDRERKILMIDSIDNYMRGNRKLSPREAQ
jgi:peroxiredoxin